MRDKNASAYIVIPASGIVSPVVNIPEDSQDYQAYMKGKWGYVDKYLADGVLRHPGSAYLGEIGNAIIAGHSSYYKSAAGRYKTVFKYLPTVDVDEEIWIYKKYDGVYRLLRYRVKLSYEAQPDDTSILGDRPDAREVTLYTCVPIGTDKNRWIVKAERIQEL